MRLGRATATAIVLLLATSLSGCSLSKDSPPTSTPKPTAAASQPAPPPPRPAPKAGACYGLTYTEATTPTNSAEPVPCSASHTSITVHVGQIDPIVDGHLVAVDSREVQAQIAKACPRRLAGWVGGDEKDRRLSRFEVIWFSPSVEESDRGANWFRCDLVALATTDTLAKLPRGDAKGVLDDSDALEQFGLCGTDAPDATDFERVVCARKHSWEAIEAIDFHDDARYLGKGAGHEADSDCHDEAVGHSSSSLTVEWSFEWPTREQWDNGQRFGYCWVPVARS